MQALLELSQPRTHDCNKHWREWLFCEEYSLEQRQLVQFDILKREANISFEQDPRWDLLSQVHQDYFGEALKKEGKHWQQLGFQSTHPQTDFRGGGVLSLRLIKLFVHKNKDLVLRMQNDKEHFLFAVTAINVAFFMKKYFHLADFLIPVRDANIYCNRRALKNFARVLSTEENAFQIMHEIFLKYFYLNVWIPAQQTQSNLFLQFNQLFDIMTALVKSIFEDYQINNFADFNSKWNDLTR